ncbi:hypothetical protein M8R20_05085 [Pseudomonas sp. R2.Fl]|nr:hypothetical protein [Pseudomonas sp. R2.Fl]
MKKILIAALLAVALPVSALAGTFNLPSDDDAVASVTIPDSWSPTEIEHGVEAVSDDDAVYISLEVADEKSMDQLIEDIFSFLEDNGVEVDPATQGETENEINGMKMSVIEWEGKDGDGPVSVGVVMFSPKPDSLVLMTYWGTKGDQDKHSDDFVGILASLKPAE